MKQFLALLLTLALLGGLFVPALATDAATTPTQDSTPATAENGSQVMLVICIVLVIAGGIYLAIGLKKSK